MNYQGRYKTFNPKRIKTYPISGRDNKVKLQDLMEPQQALGKQFEVEEDIDNQLKILAETLVNLRRKNLPVILFTGAHLIKNGLGLLLADMIKKDLLTCIAGNMATSIHDFELALIGETSEYVPKALEKGQFGMAYEFAYINKAMTLGDQYELGLGESLGKTIVDQDFSKEVFDQAWKPGSPKEFKFPDKSVMATCYEKKIPFTIHAGIGTDVTDQHPSLMAKPRVGAQGEIS
jgi:hypothetical protein